MRSTPDTMLTAWARQHGEGMGTPGNLGTLPLRNTEALPKILESPMAGAWPRTHTCQRRQVPGDVSVEVFPIKLGSTAASPRYVPWAPTVVLYSSIYLSLGYGT